MKEGEESGAVLTGIIRKGKSTEGFQAVSFATLVMTTFLIACGAFLIVCCSSLIYW